MVNYRVATRQLAELLTKFRDLGCTVTILHDECCVECPDDKQEQVRKLWGARDDRFRKNRFNQEIHE